MNLKEYVNHGVVKKKYFEYGALADYFVGYGKTLNDYHVTPFETFNSAEIDWWCSMGLDIFRSYLDMGCTLLVLDIERYSNRFKNKFCEDQGATYNSLEPCHRCAMDLFAEYGITPLVLATGQGYHYALRVDKGKYEHEMLVNIGRSGLDNEIVWEYAGRRQRMGRRTILEEGAAFNGAGKLLEFLANKIMRRAGRYGSNLQINIGDVHTSTRDDEGINLDLSCFEAPVHMRDIRMPFTTHQKQQVKSGGNPYTPIRIAIPRVIPKYNDLRGNGFELDLKTLFRLRENYWDAHNYAQNISCEIPEQAWGVAKLANDYLKSELAEFHKYFDTVIPNYVEFDYVSSDWLNPTTIKHLVETYYNPNRPWLAHQLAFFICDKYKRFQWSDFNFDLYPPYPKAKFWARAYCGMWHG